MMSGSNYLSYSEIEKFDNVKSVGSLEESNPLHDSSVTIFTNNQYSVTSNKSFYGYTLEISPTNNASHKLPIYTFTLANHFLLSKHGKKPQFEKKSSYKSEKLSPDTFEKKVKKIVGEQIWNYLRARHSGFAIIEQPSFTPVPK